MDNSFDTFLAHIAKKAKCRAEDLKIIPLPDTPSDEHRGRYYEAILQAVDRREDHALYMDIGSQKILRLDNEKHYLIGALLAPFIVISFTPERGYN